MRAVEGTYGTTKLYERWEAHSIPKHKSQDYWSTGLVEARLMKLEWRLGGLGKLALKAISKLVCCPKTQVLTGLGMPVSLLVINLYDLAEWITQIRCSLDTPGWVCHAAKFMIHHLNRGTRNLPLSLGLLGKPWLVIMSRQSLVYRVWRIYIVMSANFWLPERKGTSRSILRLGSPGW